MRKQVNQHLQIYLYTTNIDLGNEQTTMNYAKRFIMCLVLKFHHQLLILLIDPQTWLHLKVYITGCIQKI